MLKRPKSENSEAEKSEAAKAMAPKAWSPFIAPIQVFIVLAVSAYPHE